MATGLNPQDDSYNDQVAIQNPIVPEAPSPGIFDNFGNAVYDQLGKGMLSTTNAAYDAVDPFVQMNKEAFGSDAVDQFEDFRTNAKSAIVNTQIDPAVTGWLGRLAGGVAAGAVPAAIGSIGGPAGVAAAFGLAGYKDEKLELQAKGVDDTTATLAALPTGVAQGAMGFLPFGIGGSVFARMSAGAVGNMALGAGSRGLTSTILADNGYKDMAQQYKALDGSALLADGVLGGFIGAGHDTAETPAAKQENFDANLPGDTDAALAANSVRQHEIDSAPGIPTNVESRNAHVDTADGAVSSALAGNDVAIPDSMLDAEFLPKPPDPELSNDWDEARAENGVLLPDEAHRNEKYVEALGKHQQASGELDDINSQLSDLEDTITNTPAPERIFGGRDEAINDRLAEIGQQLDTGNLSKKQTAKLAQEQSGLQDEFNALHESGDYTKERAALDDLQEQHKQLTKLVDQKERQVDRYAGEVDKRGKKLGIQRAEAVPEDTQSIERSSEQENENSPAPTENASPDKASASDTPATDEANAEDGPSESDATGEEGGHGEEGKQPDNGEPDDYNTKLAQDILAEKPETEVPTGITKDEDGNDQLQTASGDEAMQQADDEATKNQELDNMVQAAINCSLRFGGLE